MIGRSTHFVKRHHPFHGLRVCGCWSPAGWIVVMNLSLHSAYSSGLHQLASERYGGPSKRMEWKGRLQNCKLVETSSKTERRPTNEDRAKDNEGENGLERSGKYILLRYWWVTWCLEAGLGIITDEDGTHANLERRISCVGNFVLRKEPTGPK